MISSSSHIKAPRVLFSTALSNVVVHITHPHSPTILQSLPLVLAVLERHQTILTVRKAAPNGSQVLFTSLLQHFSEDNNWREFEYGNGWVGEPEQCCASIGRLFLSKGVWFHKNTRIKESVLNPLLLQQHQQQVLSWISFFWSHQPSWWQVWSQPDIQEIHLLLIF